jgi:hypothetical protein
VNLCQTNPQTGQCASAIGSTVPVTIGAGQTPTFGVFVTASSFIPFDPANNRIFVRFRDPQGVTVGSTSVAVQTSLVGNYQGSGSVTLTSCLLPNLNGTSSGTFTATVANHTGNTIAGTFTLTSSSSTTTVPYTVTLTPTGTFGPTAVQFAVSVPVLGSASGNATIDGQIDSNAVSTQFSGQIQGLGCNMSGSGSATRVP